MDHHRFLNTINSQEHMRYSNFELLRIVAMFLIIFFHCVEHGNGDSWIVLREPISLNYMINLLLGSWGQVGVVLFIIISSWFLADSSEWHFRKIISISIQTWFYSVAILMIIYLCQPQKVSWKIAIQEVLTPLYQQYWFVTTYLFFYMCMPILRWIVNRMTLDNIKKVCIISTGLVLFYNMFFGIFGNNVGGSLIDFCCLFFVVVYFKRTENNWVQRHCILGGGIYLGSYSCKCDLGALFV